MPGTVIRPELRVVVGTSVAGAHGTYFIDDVIGEGGQGWVFKARFDDPDDGFPVVVKVLRPDVATPDGHERFVREAETLRALSQAHPSPYIVRFYDHGEASFPLPGAVEGARATLPFMVLELVNGPPLHEVIDGYLGRGMPLPRARRILREVHRALAIVHAHGVVHRDLKPSNLLLATDAGHEVAKVTDFGLVKLTDRRHTATQALAGVSLSYAPPEQYEPGNARVCSATDVFSFAAIAFEILCGAPAFPGSVDNPFEALRLIATAPRPRLADRRHALPDALAARPDLVAQIDAELHLALDPEPTRRTSSIEALWRATDPLLRQAAAPVSMRTPPPVSTAILSLSDTVAVDELVRVSERAPPIALAAVPDLPGPIARPALPTNPPPVVPPPSARGALQLRVVVPAGAIGAVRAVIFDEALDSVTAIAASGVVRRITGSGWSPLPPCPGVAPSAMRTLGAMPGGPLVVAGDRGMLALLHRGGRWELRSAPPSAGGDAITFHAVAAFEGGLVAVGERNDAGLVAVLSASGLLMPIDLPDVDVLRSVAVVGDRFVACGDGGALVSIDRPRAATSPWPSIAWRKGAHLLAVAGSAHEPHVAYAVGTGGHALRVDLAARPAPLVAIEGVMTTQALVSVGNDGDRSAWATSGNARIVRRDARFGVDGTWQRVTATMPTSAPLVGIGASRDRVMLATDDGALIEGRYVG